MKATHAGVVIGRALTAYNAEAPTGVVVVLVKTEWWQGPGQETQTALTLGVLPGVNDLSVRHLTVAGGIDVAGSDILNVGRIAGINETWSIDIQGNLVTKGVVASSIETSEGIQNVYGVTSPGVEVTLSGTGTLEAGRATVHLLEVPGGKLFNETVSPDVPLKIIVTLTSYANGVYVKNKSVTDFTVEELGVGTSNATFDWIAIGVKKGFEPKKAEPEVVVAPTAPGAQSDSLATPEVISSPTTVVTSDAPPVDAPPASVDVTPSPEEIPPSPPQDVSVQSPIETPASESTPL
jgi:hypothetical protein